LDAPSFLEKILLPTKAKEKLESLEEDHLVEQAVRQLGKALTANCLAISKLKGWKDQPRRNPTRSPNSRSKLGVSSKK